MINKAICINGLENHLLCHMQCCLNGVHISEVPQFLADRSSVTTHAIELTDLFNATHLLLISLQLSSLSIAEYENEDIPNNHLTAEGPPWNPSTNEYSERETQI